MGNADGESSPDLALALSYFTLTLSFSVHGVPASCMEESLGDGTDPEGNELSVPARDLVPPPSRAASGEYKHMRLR